MLYVCMFSFSMMISLCIFLLFNHKNLILANVFPLFYGLISLPFLKVYFTNDIYMIIHHAPRSGFVYSKEIDTLLLNGFPIVFLLTVIILIIKKVFDKFNSGKKNTFLKGASMTSDKKDTIIVIRSNHYKIGTLLEVEYGSFGTVYPLENGVIVNKSIDSFITLEEFEELKKIKV